MTDTPRVYGTRFDPAEAQADHEKGRAIAQRAATLGQMAGTPEFDRGASLARRYAVAPNGGGEAHPRVLPTSDFEKGLAIGRKALGIASKASASALAPAGIVPAAAAPQPVPAVAAPFAGTPVAETAPLNAAQVQMEARLVSEAFHRSFM